MFMKFVLSICNSKTTIYPLLINILRKKFYEHRFLWNIYKYIKLF